MRVSLWIRETAANGKRHGAPPECPESIETVRARIIEVVGHVAVRRKVLTWHCAIERLLKEDEKRREGQLVDPYPITQISRETYTKANHPAAREANNIPVATSKEWKPF